VKKLPLSAERKQSFLLDIYSTAANWANNIECIESLLVSSRHGRKRRALWLTRPKARFPLPELTARVNGDRFPLPVNTGRVDGRAFPLAELPVNPASGNRALHYGAYWLPFCLHVHSLTYLLTYTECSLAFPLSDSHSTAGRAVFALWCFSIVLIFCPFLRAPHIFVIPDLCSKTPRRLPLPPFDLRLYGSYYYYYYYYYYFIGFQKFLSSLCFSFCCLLLKMELVTHWRM